MNKLCKDFKNEIFTSFPNLNIGIIIYGSNIFKINSSDLDVCIIGDDISEEDKKKIEKKVIEFHNKYNLKIDQEVPYENKLIFSYQEIKDAIIDHPFVEKGIIRINPIIKTKEFLGSVEMKKRLIINILTTKHISINCNHIIKTYERKAWDLILKTIIEYAGISKLNPSYILKNLYMDIYTGNEGEMFLGYKDNCIEKEKYLIKNIKKALKKLKNKKKETILCNNLNPYLPTKRMVKKIASNAKLINSYPTATSIRIKRIIADKLNIPVGSVILTNGSTEAFDYLLKMQNCKKIGIFPPTFWGYEGACKRNDCEFEKVSLKDSRYYEYDKISELSKRVEMIMLCNPNNPTLDTLDREKLLEIIKGNRNCHFVIDETELVFCSDYKDRTLVNDAITNSNLTVITSISKFFGVPGMRCGFIVTNSDTYREINKHRIPFSVNIFSEIFMLNYFDKFNDLKLIKKIQKNFKYLISKLNSKYIKEIVNVNTGFILIRFDEQIDVNELTEYLETKRIIIRNMKKSYPNYPGEWLRISAGKKSDYRKLIKYMKKFLKTKIQKKQNDM